MYHSKAETRCGLCPGRDGCPQGVTWAWQCSLSVLIPKEGPVFDPYRRHSRAPMWLYSSAMLSDILLMHGFDVTSLDAFCSCSGSCLRHLEQHLVTFGRWIRNLGLAALFADLTNTSHRIREEVWRDVISNIAVDEPTMTGLLCSDSDPQVDALPEKGRVSWERKLNRLEEDVWQTQADII